MILFHKAMSKGDRATQITALVVARTRAMNLQNFFIDLFEDIDKLAISVSFDWPDIPENYQVPEFYKCPHK